MADSLITEVDSKEVTGTEVAFTRLMGKTGKFCLDPMNGSCAIMSIGRAMPLLDALRV
jgi:hypothetical protein